MYIFKYEGKAYRKKKRQDKREKRRRKKNNINIFIGKTFYTCFLFFIHSREAQVDFYWRFFFSLAWCLVVERDGSSGVHEVVVSLSSLVACITRLSSFRARRWRAKVMDGWMAKGEETQSAFLDLNILLTLCTCFLLMLLFGTLSTPALSSFL
jgi:hypothetical protein